jgi:uncharacterized MAPEG superfamily protein
MQHRDLYPAFVTCLALLVYFWNLMACGRARSAYAIQAPATTGHPAFERQFRIQQNMLEQLILFLPSLWLFCLSLSTLIGAGIGILFVAGRLVYSISYAKDAAKRGPGFGLGMIAVIILLLGGLIGTVRLLILDI